MLHDIGLHFNHCMFYVIYISPVEWILSLQACSEDLVRLKQEVVTCREELQEGLPKLADFEDDEAIK